MLDCAQTAALLRSWDKILVMSHASPDGDTLGSSSALLRGLVSLGKQVRFLPTRCRRSSSISLRASPWGTLRPTT